MEINLKNGKTRQVSLKYAIGFYLRLYGRFNPTREKLTEELQKIPVDLTLTHAYLFYIYNTKYNESDMSISYKDWFTRTRARRDMRDNLDVNITVSCMFFQVLYETMQNSKKQVVEKRRQEFSRINKNWQEILCRLVQQPQRYTFNEEYLKLKDPLAFYRAIAYDFEETGDYINIDKYIEEFELDVDRDKFINGMDDCCIIMKTDEGLVWNCLYLKQCFLKLDYSRFLWARMNKSISMTKIRRFHYVK